MIRWEVFNSFIGLSQMVLHGIRKNTVDTCIFKFVCLLFMEYMNSLPVSQFLNWSWRAASFLFVLCFVQSLPIIIKQITLYLGFAISTSQPETDLAIRCDPFLFQNRRFIYPW